MKKIKIYKEYNNTLVPTGHTQMYNPNFNNFKSITIYELF
jgi:hypothetical protein